MKRRVVDSNVPIVANGRDTNASISCREAALDALSTLLASGRIVVDEGGSIIKEYGRYCNPKGQPGVGDRFFREVLMNYGTKVERIKITANNIREYEEFPDDPDLTTFDVSDRKFAAVARKAKVPVLNAVDTDWLHHHESLLRNGIKVEFVCGRNCENWWSRDSG